MVVDGKGIYMIYSNSTGLILGVSKNGGASYDQRVIETGIGIKDPRITMAPGHLYVTWTEENGTGRATNQMEATNSSGISFGQPRFIAQTNGGIGSEVAASGPNLYIVFIGLHQVITAAVSHDFGSTFAIEEISNPLYPGKEISLATFQSEVFVAFESNGSATGSKHSAMLAVSGDNGTTFSVRAIPGSGSPKEAIVAASENGRIYIDNRSGGGKANEIYLDKSRDSGQRFSRPMDVSNNSGDSREPWIAVDGRDVYVSYRDTTNSSTGSYNVFISISTNGGKSFRTVQLGNETLVVSLEDDDYSPEVAASNGTVAIAWSSAVGGLEQEYISLSGNHGRSFQTIQLDQSGRDRSSLLLSLNGAYYAMWQTDYGIGAAVCR